MRRIGIYLGVALACLPAAASPQNREKDLETTLDVADAVYESKDVLANCGEAAALATKSFDQARQWRAAGEQLGKVGTAISLLSTGNDLRKKEYAKVAQTATETAMDFGACAALGPALCPAYQGGRGLGSVVNLIPHAFGSDRTLNDMWTDVVAGWVYDREPTKAQIDAMIASHRAKLQELERKARQRAPKQCEDLGAAKDAVADILGRARANASGSAPTPIGGELSRRVGEAADAANARSDAAITRGNQEIFATSQALQSQAQAYRAQESEARQQQQQQQQTYALPRESVPPQGGSKAPSGPQCRPREVRCTGGGYCPPLCPGQ